MAVVDRSMSLVEEAGAIQEITQARALEAVSPPLDLGCRATPRLALEYRPVAFREFSVEARIVGNDDYGVVREGRDGRLVDPVSRDHVVRDAGERDYLPRDQVGRLVERGKDTCVYRKPGPS